MRDVNQCESFGNSSMNSVPQSVKLAPEFHDLPPTVPAIVKPLGNPRSKMAFGVSLRFRDTLTPLLHTRLKNETLIASSLLLLGLIPTMEYGGLFVRIFIFLGFIGAYGLLSSGKLFTLRQLRSIELGVTALLIVQSLYMPDLLILESARKGDFVTATMERFFATGIWAIVVSFQGMYLLYSRRRALAILVPMSIVPELNFYLLSLFEPAVGEAFRAPQHTLPFPLMFLAAIAGVYGAYAMNSVRKEAYEAKKEAFDAKELGQYRIKEKLGSGGMGEVYRAEHKLLKRPCAIKLIRPDLDVSAATIARFEREVQATAKLSHWNTVEIYDYGRTEDGVFYYVMELLPGMSLQQLIERFGPLDPGRVVFLLRQVCAALAEAHQHGLIHRDIKPGNIIVSRRGGLFDVVKLLDFGLVKDTSDQSADAQLTRNEHICGTPAYMSPEQSGSARLDGRTDLYSLGGVAYHMLVGAPPFEAKSPFEVMVANARDPLVPPILRNTMIPEDLNRVIVRCLEKSRDARYSSATELDRALAECECAADWNEARSAAWWGAKPKESLKLEPVENGSPVREFDEPTVLLRPK